jgi:hypothetical protein
MEELRKLFIDDPEEELISFGNYLLSDERKATIVSPELLNVVGDWDLENWREREYRLMIKKLYESPVDIVVSTLESLCVPIDLSKTLQHINDEYHRLYENES